MDIRQLQYFITVVQEENYSKAAKSLHISQPSLSNAIMKLEKEVGFQLLERNTRGLTLTEGGNIFYKKAVKLLRKFNNLQIELEEIKQVGSGTISIGSIESSKFWLPKVVKSFKGIFPNIHFQFKDVLGQEKVLKALNQYNVHFTITNQPIKNEDIELTPIYHERLILLTHKEDELNQRDSITLHDLTERELIISTTGFQTREDVLRAFKHENVTPNIFYETERLETACSLVEEGLGITILPESYIKYASNPNTISHEINSKFLERTVYLAFLKNRYLSPAVYALFEEIKAFFSLQSS